jgi:hypothetical protein
VPEADIVKAGTDAWYIERDIDGGPLLVGKEDYPH